MKLDAQNIQSEPGIPLPFGAYLYKTGVQFSLFSRNAISVSLILFVSCQSDSDYYEIKLDPGINKTGDIWHIWIDNIEEWQLYAYKIFGPFEPENGHRFNSNKLLIDPYARALCNNFHLDWNKALGYKQDSPHRDLSYSTIDSNSFVPRCIVLSDRTDMEDKQININSNDTIIYELHVKGFTRHETSAVENKSTFKGLSEKIPYLKELGITAVELMPVQEFNEHENSNKNPVTRETLKNYWGYSTLAFFATKSSYATSQEPGGQVKEFKDMVKQFHDAGIEVILDIVFNHTAEGDQNGPTLSFKGIDNTIYYILDNNKRYYKNFSGCGNTFNCNHPLVRDFILDVLRYWVVEMHVDGFRFDLASILGRDQDGNMLSNPPLIEKIEEDPILRNTKIIAEAWDAAGAFQVGHFPGRWAEWNSKFRDDVRAFWRGDPDMVKNIMSRLTGSEDIYAHSGRGPLQSINFVTCHDGFTLNDLVSFNYKHNQENGEDNKDGENHNLSNNYGIEGATVTPLIERVRNQQIKNMLATLFLSQGIPMLLAGDEFRRTQKGNNNAYCQDNEISWVDWSLLDTHSDVFRFTKLLIQFRKDHPILRKEDFFSGTIKKDLETPDITWHGVDIGNPDIHHTSHSIALLINGEYARKHKQLNDSDIYMILNASQLNLNFHIPKAPSGKTWKIVINTANPSPHDIYENGAEPIMTDHMFHVKSMSSVVLITDK